MQGDPLAAVFAQQAIWCKSLGSPLYARMSTACAHLASEPGSLRETLSAFRDDPFGSLLALRFLGALHHLALTGEAPELARHYPSCGGDGDAAGAADAIVPVTTRLRERILALLAVHPQTNEVGRSAALLGGFLRIAETTKLPLRLLEIGASAGLNLRFDRFRYVCDDWSWGEAKSPVALDDNFLHAPPFDGTHVEVVERRGCDLSPIDPVTYDGLLRLRSFVWPDQLERLRLLAAAAQIAGRVGAALDREAAGTWLERELAMPRPGVATVVFHTVVMQYVTAEERASIGATLARALAAATPEAPVAHLSLEPRSGANVVLCCAPYDTAESGIANATMHGKEVRWIA